MPPLRTHISCLMAVRTPLYVLPSIPPQHCCYRPNCAKCPTLRKMDFPSLNGFPPFLDLRLHMSVFHSVKSQTHLHTVHTTPQNYSAFHPSNHPFRKTPVYAHSAQRYFAQLYSPFNSVCQTTHEYSHQMSTHAHSIDRNPLFAQTAPTDSVGRYTWRCAQQIQGKDCLRVAFVCNFVFLCPIHPIIQQQDR